MTFADALFTSALNQIRASVTVPTTPEPHTMTPFAVTARISLKSEQIAQLLADVAHLEVGLDPQPFGQLVAPTRERFRSLTERAIDSIDTNNYDSSIDRAVEEIDVWMNGPYGGPGTEPTPTHIARRAILAFLALEARPRVRR